MTIAVCYLSPEGLVLGADSTSTYYSNESPHYFNHAQKLFEVGENSTLGLVTWGLGGLFVKSHRMLVAELADSLSAKPAADVDEVARRWVDGFWDAYRQALKEPIARCVELEARPPYLVDGSPNPEPDARTEAEEREFQALASNLVAGFCIGGYVPLNRTPSAYQVIFDPLAPKPTPVLLHMHSPYGWGAPAMIKRLINGLDDGIRDAIMSSQHWSGTERDFDVLAAPYVLSQPVLPLRDAIDFVHACIYSTIKAFKFSNLSQICGGPIEIAVISADRRFRWVRHKSWDSAIDDGDQK